MTFGGAEIASGGARIAVTAAAAGDTRWNWHVEDPFGRTVASGVRTVALAAGEQKVALDVLDIPAVQGPLAFWAVARDARGVVQGWGAWAFRNEPKAAIKALTLDEGWRTEGERTTFTVALGGDVSGMRLTVAFIDSYGRTLDEATPPAAPEVKGEPPHDYIFEPDETTILENVLQLYVNNTVYSVLLEAKTGEHAARMTAMDNATKACKDMIRELTMLYNKARQAAVTSELLDIVGGAEALKA